jgi:hypothetical protein
MPSPSTPLASGSPGFPVSGGMDAGSGPRRWGHAALAMLRGRHGWLRATLLWLLLIALALRIAAPFVVTALINRLLTRPGAVQGHIDGVSLGLLTGAYSVEGLHLTVPHDVAPHERLPLLDLPRLRCQLYLGVLLQGRLEGSLALDQPTLHVQVAPSDDTKREWSLDDWRRTVASLVRFRIAEATLTDGTVAYHDRLRRIEARLSSIQGGISDLIVPAGSKRPARFRFNGVTPGSGELRIAGTALADADTPQAEVGAALEHVRLPELNPLLESYHRLAFADGVLSAYAELALAGAQIGGYVKPIFHHLQVRSFEPGKEGLTEVFWSALVPVSEYILRNVPADQHAARIPINGQVKRPEAGLWPALTSALGNAFGSALVPGFDEHARR